jgi:exoribonuclease II
LVFIKEEDFFDFQNLIRASIGRKQVEKPDPNLDPRIAEIKRKSRRAERLKAK